jgi:plastocyanin
LKLCNPCLVPVSLVLAIAIFVPINNLITSNVQGVEELRVNATILFDSTNLGDEAYEPNPIKIALESSVVWTNDDRIAHSATAIEGEFDSGILDSGELFEYTFNEVGRYDYYCMLHPSMVGQVEVQ